MTPVKVLVVDDSLTMRNLISAALRQDPEIDVVGTAADPIEARTAIKALNPDVLTLDVEMPNMNGLEFLEKIMRLRPMPVVMVSTLTAAGTDVTLAALEIGAVDAVAKPATATPEAFHDLIGKVKAAARSRVRARGDAPASAAAPRDYRADPRHVLAIGSSTGGVEALLTVLGGFPADCPATVVTQHMPATFTASFAARLDRVCAPKVSEAVDGATLAPGHVYIAPGGAAHLEVAPGMTPRCRLVASDPVNGHRPSVDVMFNAVAALGLPRLVAEMDGAVVGYAYAGPFRARQAYRYMVEDSIYVAPEARGRGVAGALLDALIDGCERMGLRQMVAVIGDSENLGSIALHRSRGFTDAGLFRAAGWKHDDWRDVVFMQRSLGEGARTPPAAPGLPLIDKAVS